MKKLLILVLTLVAFSSFAQVPALNDLVRINPPSSAKTANALDASKSFGTSGTNTYSISPGLGQYTGGLTYAAGDMFTITIGNANSSTTVTLNVDSEGAVALKNNDGTDPDIGSLCAGCTFKFRHNGTNFRMIGSSGGGSSDAASTSYVITTGTDTYVGTSDISDVTDKWLVVYFENANTGAATLNINGGGALPLRDRNNASLAAGVIKAGSVHVVANVLTSTYQVMTLDGQPLDSDLTTIAGLTPSNDDFMQRKSGAWANRTIAQVKSDLGLSGTNSGDQTASTVPVTPSGNITSTDAGAAINELDGLKANSAEIFNVQTGTSYTLQSSDFENRTYLVFTNSGAISLTVPNSVGVTGKSVKIVRTNPTGSITFIEGGSQNITPSGGALTDAGEDVAMILTYGISGANEWDLQNGNPLSITSSDIEDALGFTPADAANANLQWIATSTTADFATSSTSYVDVDPASGPSPTYTVTNGVAIECFAVIYATTSDGNGGIGISLNGPTVSSYYSHIQIPTSATAVVFRSGTTYGNETVSASILTTGALITARWRLVPTASGTAILRVSCETTVGHTITVKSGTYLACRPAP